MSHKLYKYFWWFCRQKVWSLELMNLTDLYRNSCIFIGLYRYRCIGRGPTCLWPIIKCKLHCKALSSSFNAFNDDLSSSVKPSRLHSLASFCSLEVSLRNYVLLKLKNTGKYVSFPCQLCLSVYLKIGILLFWSCCAFFAPSSLWGVHQRMLDGLSLVSIRERSVDASGPFPSSCVPDIRFLEFRSVEADIGFC